MKYYKFPRIPHLPWSKGATDDDLLSQDDSRFVGKEVVVTQKMDGECTSIYPDHYCHARSTTWTRHWSRSHIKALAASLKLSGDTFIVGENLMAVHSIQYENLESYFLMFGVFTKRFYHPWDDVEKWAKRLGLITVPVIYRGFYDKSAIRAYESQVGDKVEGYVVRLADGFLADDFRTSIAKYVRANHVQSDSHWLENEQRKNGLKE